MVEKFSQKDVSATIKNGKRIYSENILFIYLTLNISKIRTSISISKKKTKLAVKRNRVRRVIKTIIKDNKEHIKPHDGVFIIKSDISQLNFDEIKDIINSVLKNAKLNK